MTLIAILSGYFIFAMMSAFDLDTNEKYVELLGQKTWVGYQKSSLVVKLPNIRDCVFDVSLPFRGTGFESDAALAYARDYEVGRDAWVVWRNLFGKSL